MSRLSAARLATLKANAGADVDAKWRRSRSGDCLIAYCPERDMWDMWAIGGSSHSIAGDSSVARINAHWRGFVANNNAANGI
jgi:hypothetical protein